MERESFEDEEVALALNEGFVAIKVDREERPDLDQVYMAVAQSLTGRGGWPLTVFLTPDRKPFFAGTYFPKEARQGMPGLLDVLKTFREKWLTERQVFDMAGANLQGRLQRYFRQAQPGEPDQDLLDRGYKQLAERFDPEYGGFGEAPKFPSPHQLLFLLRYWKRTGAPDALQMVETTLQAMCCGGIYDHVGFGFSRYSTDRYWLVPHFEKMLYDNALLAITYLEAYQATRNSFYAGVAREVFSYVLRDMTAPEGAFYSAEDADSEGEEGRFYLWTPDQVKQALGERRGGVLQRFLRRHRRRELRGAQYPQPGASPGGIVSPLRPRSISYFPCAPAGGAPEAVCRPGVPGAPPQGRQGAHLLERADDRRPRPGGLGPGRS